MTSLQSDAQAHHTVTCVFTHLQRINKKPVTPFKSSSGRRLLQLKTQTADSLQSSIKNNGIETVSGIDSCRVDLASDTAALDACVSDMWWC